MQKSDVIRSEEDLGIFMAYKFCTSDESTAVESRDAIREHYERCEWCQDYVRQRKENSPNWISEVGWWSGYADRERF